MTEAQRKLAVAFMEDPQGRHYGYDLGVRADLRSGMVYPALRRWEEDGLVTAAWEEHDATEKRPPRRYYYLTEKGLLRLGVLAAQAEAVVSRRVGGSVVPGPTGGHINPGRA